MVLQYHFIRDPRHAFGIVYKSIRLFCCHKILLQQPQQQDNPLVSRKPLEVTRPWFESQSCSSFLFKSQSHLLSVLQVPICEVVLLCIRNGFIRSIYYLCEMKKHLHSSRLEKDNIMSACRLLIILFSPYSSLKVSHYSHI